MKEYILKGKEGSPPMEVFELDGFQEGVDKSGKPVLYKATTIKVTSGQIDNEINHLTERLADLNLQKKAIDGD